MSEWRGFPIDNKPEEIPMPKYCRNCLEPIPASSKICPKCGKFAGYKIQNEYWLMPVALRITLFLSYLYRYIKHKISVIRFD